MIWTDEKVAELLQLKSEGMSHSKIARKIGCGTRNEVTGKLWRIMKRKRQPETNRGRPIGSGRSTRCGGEVWDERTFLPYAQWKVWNSERRAR